MKAVFEFRGVKSVIKVPKYLYYINYLTNKICELDTNDFEFTDIGESYDYLEERLRVIFARNHNLDPSDLYCEFMIASTEEEEEFGCLVAVHHDND
jgi:hypothetical protein